MLQSVKPILCLMGPTAMGKTEIGLALAQRFPIEIISVDSAMVYRGMDIGTAKPNQSILAMTPHHLINIRDPKHAYSAAEFREDALLSIHDIHQRGKIPLFIGGTLLYFEALQRGLSALPSANQVIREALLEEAGKKGWPYLHARLMQIDPIAATRIHPHDGQRIQRALEVYAVSGETLTHWNQKTMDNPSPYLFHSIVLLPEDRQALHKRIEERFLQMLKAGFIDEVRMLYERDDLNIDTPAIRSVGYRQIWRFLSGEINYAEMQEAGIAATRQLAKRQMTWLRWRIQAQASTIFNYGDPKILAVLTQLLR